MKETTVFGLFLLFIIGSAVFIFGTTTIMLSTEEHITFQGEVTYSEVVTEDGAIKYLIIGFNNQTPIKVYSGSGFGDSLDFTVHSKLVVEFSRPTFWFYASDVYSVVSIVKLPDNK
jgi:hypothetical protein